MEVEHGYSSRQKYADSNRLTLNHPICKYETFTTEKKAIHIISATAHYFQKTSHIKDNLKQVQGNIKETNIIINHQKQKIYSKVQLTENEPNPQSGSHIYFNIWNENKIKLKL